jgi:phospholipase C
MLPAMSDSHLTRRTFLRGAAGGAAAVAAGSLPAWARPITHATRLRHPDSRPFPHLPAGYASMPEIEHIVVLMMENHSFDNILGLAGHQIASRRGTVDGLRFAHGRPLDFNLDANGRRVYAHHAASPCQLHAKPSQAWDASHTAWDGGRNDGFVLASGDDAMWYWDKHDLPYTYSLARHFPIGQRYFCSVLAQTYPNRRFFFAGTASGSIDDKAYALTQPAANGTIFDRFDAHGITYASYFQEIASWFILPNVRNNPSQFAKGFPIAQFFSDAAAGKLPQFTFIDPNYTTTSEENPQDIQVGERFIAAITNAILRSPNWKRTAFFITYDEHGGYYDHVPPPRAIPPDNIKPQTYPGENAPGGYDRYGFRVPMIVVSPWAKRHYVSNVVQDHTSMLAFIERKWNLPALTLRDANADPMLDYFDFTRAAFATPPALAAAPSLGPGLAACQALGLTPPLPS